jgi:hypothetical protein
VSADSHLLTIISGMKRAAAIAVALLLTCAPRVQTWGFEAHKFIMDRAIALLPQEMRPLYERHRSTLIERSIDPDTWRTAGFANEEDPNHFVDLDWQGFGPYPFNGLPRDYTAAVAKFGRNRIRETGTLPWALEERYGALRRAFEDYARRGMFGQNDIIFFSAWLTHYVSDAHVPFHAVINHDGQLTGQNGIHARFESAMFERYRDRLTLAAKPIAPIRDPREFAFATLLQSNQLVPAILKADLEAIGTRDEYDEVYYEAFFTANRAVLERRINEAIAATAAMIAGAWEAAGKPALPVAPPLRPQRRAR